MQYILKIINGKDEIARGILHSLESEEHTLHDGNGCYDAKQIYLDLVCQPLNVSYEKKPVLFMLADEIEKEGWEISIFKSDNKLVRTFKCWWFDAVEYANNKVKIRVKVEKASK